MAATLKWDKHPFGGQLWLGNVAMMADVWREGRQDNDGRSRVFVYSTVDRDAQEGGPFGTVDEAFRAAEARVKALLKEAGVVDVEVTDAR